MKNRQTCEIDHLRNRGLNKMNFGNTSKISFCALNKRKVAIVPFFVALFLIISVVRGETRSDKGKGVSQSDAQTNNCHNCAKFRTDMKDAAIENIKGKILNAMGFENPPSFPKRLFPPLNQIMNLYSTPEVPHTTRHKNSNSVSIDDSEEEERVKIQSEMYQGDQCPECLKYLGHRPFVFKFDSTTQKQYETIELMLYFNNSQFCSENVSVSVFKLMQRLDEPESYILSRSKQVNLQQFFSFNQRHDSNQMKEHHYRHKGKMESSWISIDYKDVIQNHLKEMTDANNLTLVIMAKYNTSGTPVECPDLTKNASLHPVLRFEYQEKTNKRTKRTPKQDCKENGNTTECCRYPLTIDFDIFKWDFIIAPRTYEAFYCAGECPYLWKQELPHTHLVSLTEKKFGGPCCSPKKMNAIDMLYFTSKGTILFGKIGGMVVEKCGCS